MNIKILSGSALKIMAVISMLIDHASSFLFADYEGINTVVFSVGNLQVTPYFCLSYIIGRLAFPLFAFLIVEGYLHTRSVMRYARTLFIFAVASILPYNYASQGAFFSFHGSNVLFTLFLGVVCLYSIDHTTRLKSALMIVVSLIIAFFIKCNYGPAGVAMIIAMYLLKQRREYQCLPVVIAFMSRKTSMFATMAAIPIMMYNGERGFIRGNVGKYLIYIIYPLHLLIIGCIRDMCPI